MTLVRYSHLPTLPEQQNQAIFVRNKTHSMSMQNTTSVLNNQKSLDTTANRAVSDSNDANRNSNKTIVTDEHFSCHSREKRSVQVHDERFFSRPIHSERIETRSINKSRQLNHTKRRSAPSKKPQFAHRCCKSCAKKEDSFGSDKDLLQCKTCRQCYHACCHKPTIGHLLQQYRSEWQCEPCKTCVVCNRNGDQIICNRCDKSYHFECAGLKDVPEDKTWHCIDCEGRDSAEEPGPDSEENSLNIFYEEDDVRNGIAWIEIDADPVADFALQLQNIWNRKQALLEDAVFITRYVTDEEIYSELELVKHEEEVNNYLNGWAEQERVSVRKYRELVWNERTRALCEKIGRIRKNSNMRITNQEVRQALEKFSESEILSKLNDPLFLYNVRKSMVVENSTQESVHPTTLEQIGYESEHDSEDLNVTCKAVSKGAKKKSSRSPHLKLNDAMKDTTLQSLWSDARKKAFSDFDNRPNKYYYRFNAPGQDQKNGPWTAEEKELFLQQYNLGFDRYNPQWGIFSMAIPGRVGYQCSSKKHLMY